MSGATNSSDIGQALSALQGQAKPSNPYVHTGALEPLAMLQAYRAGQPVINPHFQRPAQFLPQALPAYTPPVESPHQVVINPITYSNAGQYGGPAGGNDADGGAAAAAASAAAGDGAGGGSGGAK